MREWIGLAMMLLALVGVSVLALRSSRRTRTLTCDQCGSEDLMPSGNPQESSALLCRSCGRTFIHLEGDVSGWGTGPD